MTDQSKHQMLVTSIAEAVKAILAPDFQTLKAEFASEFANIGVAIDAMTAQVEALGPAPPGAPKRPPRTERKTAAGGATAAKAPAAAGAGNDPWEKVKNAMLYCRRMYANDATFRDRYQTEAFARVIAEDPTVSKKDMDSEDRLLAAGSVLWRKCLSDPQKKEITNQFKQWKVDREVAALGPALHHDDGGPVDEGEEEEEEA